MVLANLLCGLSHPESSPTPQHHAGLATFLQLAADLVPVYRRLVSSSLEREIMQINRRVFLEGIAATTGMTALAGEVSSGAKLKLGILSDVHLRDPGSEQYFVKALTWFKGRGADGVIVAGDMADRGLLSELQLVGDAWYRVFPDDKAEDGRHVEKLFVYGNHDVEGFTYWEKDPQRQAKLREKSVVKDMAGAWEECLREPFAPIYSKTVKGYTFIGMHWGNTKRVKEFVGGLAPKLDPSLPFFYAQHAHPQNTCYGGWAWGAWDDKGAATAALSPYPNAMAFSGHSHYSLTDERGIWQGAFTSIGTSSLSYTGMPYGRENGDSDNPKACLRMPRMATDTGKQGMFLSVFDDRVVIERRDFVFDESLGPDWVLPLPCRGEKDMPLTFKKRSAQSVVPEFASDAKVTLSTGKGKNRNGKEEDQMTVSFPAAIFHNTRDRVFDYEVQAQVLDCDTVKPFCTKRVFAEGYFLSDARMGKTGRCVFALDELPHNVAFRFAVRPAECFGKMGRAIYSEKKQIE